MKKAAEWALGGMLCPAAVRKGATMALESTGIDRIESLLEALNDSDPEQALIIYAKILEEGGSAREVHRSLYPVVQRVLNPPYINPHLPKMYAIHRELTGYLEAEDVSSLVRLEIREYARRPKLEDKAGVTLPKSPVTFHDIETAIRNEDQEAAAGLMAGFLSRAGGPELARRLLILGSNYLSETLGHSISCTAFILREMLEREGEDPWPAIFSLAHYYCKGRFHNSPPVNNHAPAVREADSKHSMVLATSGRGIVNLHHTITFYALNRVKHLFSMEEYRHLFDAVNRFMGDKEVDHSAQEVPLKEPPKDYGRFFKDFSESDEESVVSSISNMMSSKDERLRLGRYLVRGVCDLYQGAYDPHCLTGLGSLLWVLEKYYGERTICLNALHQYLHFYFRSIG